MDTPEYPSHYRKVSYFVTLQSLIVILALALVTLIFLSSSDGHFSYVDLSYHMFDDYGMSVASTWHTLIT